MKPTEKLHPLHPKMVVHHGSKFIAKFFENSGIPEGYSSTVAWFAERMILALVCISTAAFAGGVLFVVYLSEPIAYSPTYDFISARATRAEEGIKTYTQQIIDVASPVFAKLIRDNREELEKEQIAKRKEILKKYLIGKNSPFAKDDKALEAFAESKNMKLMVAISFVESTFGQHCYYFNCSGIGGAGLRRYTSYEEWILDFDKLLEDRYKDLPPEEFIGLYVQPGSPNWLFGVKQVLGELKDAGIEG